MHMYSAVYAVAWCLSVCHKMALYRNGGVDRADFRLPTDVL